MSDLIVVIPLLILAAFIVVAGVRVQVARAQLLNQHGRSPADARAEAMLRELLTEREQQDLARHGYLEVASPSKSSRAYRIPRRRGQVTLYEDGVPIATLCVQPVVSVPDADVVLVHKVLIEADEAMYLSVANRFRVRGRGFTRW